MFEQFFLHCTHRQVLDSSLLTMNAMLGYRSRAKLAECLLKIHARRSRLRTLSLLSSVCGAD